MSARAHTVIRLVALAVLVAVAFLPRSEHAEQAPVSVGVAAQ